MSLAFRVMSSQGRGPEDTTEHSLKGQGERPTTFLVAVRSVHPPRPENQDPAEMKVAADLVTDSPSLTLFPTLSARFCLQK